MNLTLAQLTALQVILRQQRWDKERLVKSNEEEKEVFMQVYEIIGDEWNKRMDQQDWKGKSPHLDKMRLP
tara:strand:- start:243 stop:452 length:210 start_codon:yes stop_codon:yes gene_type:complete